MAGNKIIGDINEKERQQKIVKQWQAFSRTDAYKDMMEYADAQRAMFLKYAEEMAMPSPVKSQSMMPISQEIAMSLLQNRRGIGIMTSYISSRVEQM